MKRPLFALALAVMAMLTFAAPGSGGVQRVEAADNPFNIASETYYRLDVPNGAASVKVDAKIQNATSSDLAGIYLWAMPVLTDLVVSHNGNPLVATVVPITDDEGAPLSRIDVTFEKPIKKNAIVTLAMTYIAPPQESKNITMAAGVVEALLIGQGPGSFVLVDSPKSAVSYHDPGCLKASNQPKEVVADDLERWVCGEATVIALSAEDQSVAKQCAGMDDKCRQRLITTPYSAFAQSITDSALLGTLEAPVGLVNGDVTLKLLYFRKDSEWAKREFDLAIQALPKLETLFGFPYPHGSITMLQSHHIAVIGAAGVAFPTLGQVLIAPGTSIDEWATVHELAHQWAGQNLEHKSFWEGLAEWSTQQLAPQLGVPTTGRYFMDWQSYPYKDIPLIGWDEYWGGSSDFWYAKAAAFYTAYEQAIGGRENMTKVLSQIGADPAKPRDHRWFMDRGEEISGANLDTLFLDWVFYKETATPLIAERRAAKTEISGLATRAAAAGLTSMPKDIGANMEAWQFGGIARQVAEADAVIVSYANILTLASESGLVVGPAVNDSWPTRSLRETASVVEETRQAIVAITTAADQLSEDAVGQATLQEARDAFAAGKLAEAKDLAARSRTLRFNAETAAALISVAVERQATFEANLFTRIGLMGKDPDADLAAAQAAMAADKPEEAIVHAKSAYKAWDGAEKNGMARLAIAFALMAGLSVGTWYLLKKIDVKKPDADTLRRRAAGGHVLQPADDRKGGWKDFDNK